AEDNRERARVVERPAERLDPARHDRHALLHRHHRGSRMGRPRIAELLARPLHEHADYVPFADEPARDAQRVAVALAAPHAERAGHAQQLADDGDGEQLDLRHVADRPRRVDADRGRVDRAQVVRREDGATRGGNPRHPVAGARGEHAQNSRQPQPQEAPDRLRVLAEQREQPEPEEHYSSMTGATTTPYPCASSRSAARRASRAPETSIVRTPPRSGEKCRSSKSSMLIRSAPSACVIPASTPGRSGMWTRSRCRSPGSGYSRSSMRRRLPAASAIQRARKPASPAASASSSCCTRRRWSASAARRLSALSRKMSTQIRGLAPATRVMSRREPPAAASGSCPSTRLAPAWLTSRLASACGRWLVSATSRSCARGSTATGVAPRPATNPCTNR